VAVQRTQHYVSCAQNITWLVEDNRSVVERAGGIECILDAMRFHSHNVEVQKWGCGALQNLACCGMVVMVPC
jgi:hypothetical protein